MISGKKLFQILCIAALAGFSLSQPKTVLAQPPQGAISTPSQLIDAVNSLRISYGLAPLAVHSVLMQTAQGQADYMAATGNVTHTRPGGITYTQQLIMLGFPLAGDLSLGGFRAENILSNYGVLDWNGVPSAWQDADHMNTMLSQNFTHIGAGISQGAGGYYYAVDCAASTGSGQMQDSASSILGTASGTEVAGSAAISQFMVPITKSTANPNGDVIHKVQYGQTLWSIAIDYGTTIKNIQALNNLGEDLVVYQGQELLVLKGATPPPPSSPTVASLPTSIPTLTAVPSTPEIIFPFTAVVQPTQTSVVATTAPSNSDGSSSMLVVLLIFASLFGGAMAVWLIRDPKA